MSGQVQMGPSSLVHPTELGNTVKPLTLIDKQPGKLSISGEIRASYEGVAAKMFEAANGPLDAQLNEWAEQHKIGYIVVGMHFNYPHLLVFYTAALESEDIREMEDHYEEWQQFVREKRAARTAKKAEEEAAAKAVFEEEAEMIVLGRKCKENHGHLIKELRKEKKK